jgi:hypothetical protein
VIDAIRKASRKDWVVYAKPPFSGPAQVLEYVSRYTHRIAISNHRILSFTDNKVTFTWRDYRDGNRQKVMTLEAIEFLRRFLLHVLPDRFVRIRYFGFLANRQRKTNIELARKLIGTEVVLPVRQRREGLVLCPVCYAAATLRDITRTPAPDPRTLRSPPGEVAA